VRELAASTVFTALYFGAVEGSERLLGPVHVYRMTEEQAAKANHADREAYATAVLKKKYNPIGTRWYADNTREPIRDETLRDGLVAIGAVVRSEDMPTTSGLPLCSEVRFRCAFRADIGRCRAGEGDRSLSKVTPEQERPCASVDHAGGRCRQEN
jgi:hypothetical protein